MPKQNTLTQGRLKELLHYDPDTGVFTRAVDLGRWRKGTRAGNVGGCGYTQIKIDGVKYQAHRVAWFYVHGVWPSGLLDHANGERGDNRILNLRLATRSENAQNIRRPRRTNLLGALGVSRHHNKYRAGIAVSGVRRYLGLFSTLEEAERAYAEAKNKYHPFSSFANAV